MKQPVYYLKFTENAIFTDAKLNIFFNQLYTFLMNSLTESEVDHEFLIDGYVALILQNSVDSKASADLRFSTSSKNIFNLLKSSMSSLPVSEFEIGEGEIRLRFAQKLITIAFNSNVMNRVDVDGMGVRDKSEIIKTK